MNTDAPNAVGWEWEGPRVLRGAINSVLARHAKARIHVEWFEALDFGTEISLITGEMNALVFSAPKRSHAAGDAGYYRHLIQELLAGAGSGVSAEGRDGRLLEASEILGRETLTLALESAVLARLRQVWAAVRLRVVVVHIADASDMPWLRWFLGVILEIDVQQVVVFSPEKPPGSFLKPDIYWPSFLEMIGRIDEEMAANPEATATDSEPKPNPGFWRRIFMRLTGGSGTTAHASPGVGASQWIQDDRWRYFFAKQTFPSHGLARKLWQAVVNADLAVNDATKGAPANMGTQTLEKSQKSGKDNNNRNLLFATRSELEILRGRARFLATLRVLRPAVYEAARESLDGADQLYRLQLVLCGGAKNSAGLAGALVPEWQHHLQDSRLVELFRSAFSDLNAQGFPLIQRFESRNQLEFHIAWLDGRERGSEMDGLRELFRTWILENGSQLPALVPQKRLELAVPSARSLQLSGADQLEIAQMILADAELFGEFSKLPAALELLDLALGNSVGAVRLECLLARSRILALQEDYMAARELLRGLRRAYPDALACQAIALHESFVRECERDYFSAMQGYVSVLRASEELAADELSARAVLGYLRCQATMTLSHSTLDEHQHANQLICLRASVMLQVQAARAPQLFPLSERERPRVFLSYRKESGSLVSALHARLSADFLPWYDGNLKEPEDFSPTIHSALLDSDAVVFVFSPRFFESPWCVHELHFAIGQHEVRAMPLYWCWCDPQGSDAGDIVDLALERWKTAYLQKIANPCDPQQISYHRRHVEDRLGRVLAVGTRLHSLVIRAPSTDAPEDAAEAINPWVESFMKSKEYLYERAVLPVTKGTDGRPLGPSR